jgi:eukaryotic-like serine/threonine-protein kinase
MTTPRLVEETGHVLGDRYRLVAPVGVGTSSRVFMAVDTQLRRRVAVKLLHEALAEDEAFLRRFRAEARAAGALSHANILAVFDWGEDRDQDGPVVPYLVTEYLGGGSLRGVLDRGEPLTGSQSVVVGLDAARALAHAHQRGLVHRDVKPGNLLFDEEGRLRLADFGLARALAEASWTEPSGAAVGTARYASPEQALGRRLDGKSDVYSLALVLVECLTGRVPFTGDTTASTLALRTQGDLELGDELGPLGPVLERAGRLDPADRPDASEFEVLLMEAGEGMPRPDRLPLVPTLGDGEETSELFLVRELEVLDPGGALQQRPVATAVDVVDVRERPTADAEPGPSEELAAPLRSDDGRERNPILVAEEHERLNASRPSSFGPVDPLVGAPAAGKEDQPSRQRRWPRRLLAVLAVMALLAGGGAAWWFLVRVPVHDVPDLVGRNLPEVEALASQLGWELPEPATERRDGTVAGEVLDQDPPSGSQLEEGGSLRVTVSLGPTLTQVPDVAGLSEAEARASLEAAELAVGEVSRVFDEEVAAEAVISQAVADSGAVESDGTVPKGTQVDLVVSDGPAPREVPGGLDGMTRANAEAALAEVQLVADVSQEYSDSVAAGVVMRSSPSGGAEVPRGAAVELVVSLGPAPIPVPDVRWITGSMATAQLEAAGFRVAGIEGSPSGMVLATDPVAGELRQRGTSIRLFTRR